MRAWWTVHRFTGGGGPAAGDKNGVLCPALSHPTQRRCSPDQRTGKHHTEWSAQYQPSRFIQLRGSVSTQPVGSRTASARVVSRAFSPAGITYPAFLLIQLIGSVSTQPVGSRTASARVVSRAFSPAGITYPAFLANSQYFSKALFRLQAGSYGDYASPTLPPRLRGRVTNRFKQVGAV